MGEKAQRFDQGRSRETPGIKDALAEQGYHGGEGLYVFYCKLCGYTLPDDKIEPIAFVTCNDEPKRNFIALRRRWPKLPFFVTRPSDIDAESNRVLRDPNNPYIDGTNCTPFLRDAIETIMGLYNDHFNEDHPDYGIRFDIETLKGVPINERGRAMLNLESSSRRETVKDSGAPWISSLEYKIDGPCWAVDVDYWVMDLENRLAGLLETTRSPDPLSRVVRYLAKELGVPAWVVTYREDEEGIVAKLHNDDGGTSIFYGWEALIKTWD